jgi:hypothetical protein
MGRYRGETQRRTALKGSNLSVQKNTQEGISTDISPTLNLTFFKMKGGGKCLHERLL